MRIITNINKSFANIFKLTTIGVSVWGISVSSTLAKKGVEDCKSEIERIDAKRFETFTKNDPNEGLYSTVKYWTSAYREVQDSVKNESKIQRAYFEGVQNAKNNINKK